MRGFRTLSSMRRAVVVVTSGPRSLRGGAPSTGAGSRLLDRAHGAITLGDDLDEPPRELAFRAFAERELAARPEHRQLIRFAIETAVAADLIRRDHVDALRSSLSRACV